MQKKLNILIILLLFGFNQIHSMNLNKRKHGQIEENDKNNDSSTNAIVNNLANKKVKADVNFDVETDQDNDGNNDYVIDFSNLLGLPDEVKLLILSKNIESIVYDKNNNAFEAKNKALAFIRDISLVHREFAKFNDDLLKFVYKYLKDRFSKGNLTLSYEISRCNQLHNLVHVYNAENEHEIANLIISGANYNKLCFSQNIKPALERLIELGFSSKLINLIKFDNINKYKGDRFKFTNNSNFDIKVAIALAIKYDKFEILKTLLNYPGVNTIKGNIPTINYQVPVLIEAVLNNDINKIKLLLDSGFDINAVYPNYITVTALHTAIYYSYENVIRFLLEKGASPDIKDVFGYTALTAALHCVNFNSDITKMLIKYSKDLNVKNSEGYTVLMHAVNCGNYNIAEELIEVGANVNLINEHGETPLWFAVFKGNIDLVKLLIANGADVNAKNNYGRTPLMHGILKNQVDIVEELIKAGANLDVKNNNGNTALIWAVINGYKDIVQLLIDNDANVNEKNSVENNALMMATMKGHKDIVQLLIDNDAHVNEKNNCGVTALMYAVINGYKDIAQLLIDNGANVSQADNEGDTALIFAVECGHIGVAQLLIDNGADVNEKNNFGNTVLRVAKLKGCYDLVELTNSKNLS